MLILQIKHLVWPFHHNSRTRRSCASDDDWRRRHFRTESLRCQRLGFLVLVFLWSTKSCATKKNNQSFPVGARVGNGACYEIFRPKMICRHLRNCDIWMGSLQWHDCPISETTTQGFKRFWPPFTNHLRWRNLFFCIKHWLLLTSTNFHTKHVRSTGQRLGSEHQARRLGIESWRHRGSYGEGKGSRGFCQNAVENLWILYRKRK